MEQETPYAVTCRYGCGRSFLDHKEYMRQMSRPNALWQCPKCGDSATWDDANYEKYLEELEKNDQTTTETTD